MENRTDSALSASALEICGAIFWLSHLIERFAQARLCRHGLPAGMSFSRALLILAVHNGQRVGASRMSDVAIDLGVTARTVTTMVDGLERDGLMVRQPDPKDRRAIQLELTTDGAAIVPVLGRALETIGASILAPLSQAEQAALLILLDRLIEREGTAG